MTPDQYLAAHVAEHLEYVVFAGPDRRVGGPGNAAATEYVAQRLDSMGYSVERLAFDCVDWVRGASRLSANGSEFEVWAGPYSPAVDIENAPLLLASSVEELAALKDAAGSVLLLHGELVKDQLTPRNYPFYSFEAHKRILGELDRLQPAAIVAATGSNPGAVGALSPFPYIEDADFHTSSAYIREGDAARFIEAASSGVTLSIDSGRIDATAEQLVGSVGSGAKRVVLSAHIDSRFGTPGALDNAAGVACLLGAAELLAAIPPRDTRVEIVPFNGEDNFAAYGEMAYIASRDSHFDDITFAVNIDAAGYRGHPTAISSYSCDDAVQARVDGALCGTASVEAGPQWPMSDHMIFAMRGVPTIAVTSAALMELAGKYTHTERDVIGLVDAALLAEAAEFIAEAVRSVVEVEQGA